jgi:hypothetical protein
VEEGIHLLALLGFGNELAVRPNHAHQGAFSRLGHPLFDVARRRPVRLEKHPAGMVILVGVKL